MSTDLHAFALDAYEHHTPTSTGADDNETVTVRSGVNLVGMVVGDGTTMVHFKREQAIALAHALIIAAHNVTHNVTD